MYLFVGKYEGRSEIVEIMVEDRKSRI